MENTTNEKRYKAKLIHEEYRDYINVPVYLYKSGFMDRNEIQKIASDVDELSTENDFSYAREKAQQFFTEREINELFVFSCSQKGVKLVIEEITLPIKLKDVGSYEELACGTYDEPTVDLYNFRDERNILSFSLKGYSDLDHGLNKKEKWVKVWALTTKDTNNGKKQLSRFEIGELSKYDCNPLRTYFVGEVTESFFKEVCSALNAKYILGKVFRFLEPVSDPSTLPSRPSIFDVPEPTSIT